MFIEICFMKRIEEIEMRRIRVEIVEIGSGKVVSVIGKNLNKKQAKIRESMGMMRTNLNDFFVRQVDEETGEVL